MKTVEEIIAKTLNIKIEDINDRSGPDTTESWDSFNALILVSELEKNFNVKFTIDEVVGVKNVADIKSVLKKHGIKTQ